MVEFERCVAMHRSSQQGNPKQLISVPDKLELDKSEIRSVGFLDDRSRSGFEQVCIQRPYRVTRKRSHVSPLRWAFEDLREILRPVIADARLDLLYDAYEQRTNVVKDIQGRCACMYTAGSSSE